MDSNNSTTLFLIGGGVVLIIVGLLNKAFRSKITSWNDKAYDRLGATSGSTGGSVKIGGIIVLAIGIVMVVTGLIMLATN